MCVDYQIAFAGKSDRRTAAPTGYSVKMWEGPGDVRLPAKTAGPSTEILTEYRDYLDYGATLAGNSFKVLRVLAVTSSSLKCACW
jgi:hypothetical protein